MNLRIVPSILSTDQDNLYQTKLFILECPLWELRTSAISIIRFSSFYFYQILRFRNIIPRLDLHFKHGWAVMVSGGTTRLVSPYPLCSRIHSRTTQGCEIFQHFLTTFFLFAMGGRHACIFTSRSAILMREVTKFVYIRGGMTLMVQINR